MVRLNLTSLLILGASVAYADDCTTTQSVTQISTVPVYAGHHTGDVENTATAAYVPDPTFGLQPTFSLYVPISEYDNAIGFNVEVSDVSEGLTISADSWKLFSGDVNDFGQLDSSVFSVDGNTLEFVGLTKDPLFMITIAGNIDDASYPSYSAQFVIYLNLADSDINLAKRDLLAITVNPTIVNPDAVETATSGASSSITSAASVSVINSSVTGSTFVSQDLQDITVTLTSTPTVTTNTASTSTITAYSTTLITTTSCFDNSCSTTVVPAVVSEVTTIIGDLTTIYTTTCPLSSAVEDNHTTETKFSTVTQTMTSCSGNKCSTYLAAVSEVSTVIDDITTVYTTTCPLSEAPETSSTETIVATSKAFEASLTTETIVSTSETSAVSSTEAPVNTVTAAKTSVSSVSLEEESTSTAMNTITMTKAGKASTEAPVATSASFDSYVSVKPSSSSASVTIATDFAVFDAGAGHPTVGNSFITAVMGAILLVLGF